MHVLLLNQYFWPDISAAAQLSTDLAEDLVRAGAQVSVITGRQPYVAGETSSPLPSHERHADIDITRVPMTGFGRDRLWTRSIDYSSFLLSTIAAVARRRTVDVVISLATPPFLATAAMLHKRLHKSRFVYWVQDLFPDAAIELGYLPRRGLATRTLEGLTRTTFRSADAIIAIGECMAERIADRYGVDRQRIEVVHNWADGDTIRPIPHADNWFRHQHGLGGKFVVLYSGNMGRGHTFDALTGAARALRDRTDIVFLFIGAGPRLAEIQAATSDLPNVCFLPYQPREHLAHSLSAADLGVITLRPEVVGTMVPSKLYAYMAAGLPIAFIGPKSASTARVIRESRCGAHFSSHQSLEFSTWLTHLADSTSQRRLMGEHAHSTLEALFARSGATASLAVICRRAFHG